MGKVGGLLQSPVYSCTKAYTDGHQAKDAPELPLNLLDALRALEASAPLRTRLGDGFVASYARLRHQEWTDYSQHLSQWERDRTLDC